MQNHNMPRRRHKLTTTTIRLPTRRTRYARARRSHQQHIRRHRDPTVGITTNLLAVNIPAYILHSPMPSIMPQAAGTLDADATTHIHIATALRSDTAAWAFAVTTQTHDDQHMLLGVAANFLDQSTLQRHAIATPSHRAAYAIATTYALAAVATHKWSRCIRIHTPTPTAIAASATTLLTGAGTLPTTLFTMSHSIALGQYHLRRRRTQATPTRPCTVMCTSGIAQGLHAVHFPTTGSRHASTIGPLR